MKGMKHSAKTDSKSTNQSVLRQLVGNLIYLTTTRLDLSFVVSYKSRFMTNPEAEYSRTTKRVLRYVKCTVDFGILYGQPKK